MSWFSKSLTISEHVLCPSSTAKATYLEDYVSFCLYFTICCAFLLFPGEVLETLQFNAFIKDFCDIITNSKYVFPIDDLIVSTSSDGLLLEFYAEFLCE
jgi:hypothetical protein